MFQNITYLPSTLLNTTPAMAHQKLKMYAQYLCIVFMEELYPSPCPVKEIYFNYSYDYGYFVY